MLYKPFKLKIKSTVYNLEKLCQLVAKCKIIFATKAVVK